MRLTLLCLTWAATAAASPLELSPKLRTLLDGGGWDATPAGFRIIALSFLSDGCAQQGVAHPERAPAARACVDSALRRALALRRGADLWAADGLYLSHLNLILGARDALGADPDPAFHERLTRRLAEESERSPTRHLASYASQPFRWPADQAATLASLARYDRAHGTQLHRAPLREWKAFLGPRAREGLPWSEVTGRAKGAKLPRGCAQSWMTRYLAEVDPRLAADWWKRYRAGYLVQVGPVVGFREWPRGTDLAADDDSGPILMGIGASASAFAISAARAQGDEALASRLEGAADAVSRVPGLGGVSGLLLAQAIRFQARWQPHQSSFQQ